MAVFETLKELGKHFEKHGASFGTPTAADYLAKASALIDGPCPADAQECERNCPGKDSDPKRIRFRDSTGEYAIVLRDAPGWLVTYHILNPAGTPGAVRTHAFATNQEFFDADCNCLT